MIKKILSRKDAKAQRKNSMIMLCGFAGNKCFSGATASRQSHKSGFLKFTITNILAVLLLFSAANLSAAGRDEETFFKANQAYKNGDYKEAAKLYSEIVNASGHVYFNMGNTFFKSGDLGNAVLNYERAANYIPRDADLKFNKGYVKDRCKDAVASMLPPLGGIFFWLTSFSLGELFIFFAVINLLFFAALVLRRFIKRELTFALALTLFILWLLAGPSFCLKWYQVSADTRAVIIPSEAIVRAGPDTKDTELFKLHGGTIVGSEKSESGWTLISIPDARRGWVNNNSIGFIAKN